MTQPQALTVSEADWQATVIELAAWHGWHVHHDRPARTVDGWRTAIQGNPGFPDLVLAHPTRGVLFVELKAVGGKVSEAQHEWLQRLNGQVWRPRDRALVEAVLAGREIPCPKPSP